MYIFLKKVIDQKICLQKPKVKINYRLFIVITNINKHQWLNFISLSFTNTLI